MMKKLFLPILILLFALPAIAANTVEWTPDKLTVTISAIDSDWDSTDVYPNGMRIFSIRFHPGATDNICSIEDKNNGNVKHFFVKCADTYDDRVEYKPKDVRLKLYLDYDDTDDTWTAAYTTGCSITIQLWKNQDD